ncbi:MAG TPA: aminotransferase class III-fold pyridoxal phosphate-dependent enzyme [Smithellaceae bacterium]|nr:aminotransferase class III-fold pyridoxal phosphate-dependent enzyme [Smithellaceae bacterium]HRS83719.1 aminotransferase class III-fold pyridoxal phosphate-dependent enzyme [Smithellaceae bacterium]HRV44069.1 aminotransferase class III-fold pyridoxal phosphate-dependent enzyme [Smithellaceae bacterium]
MTYSFTQSKALFQRAAKVIPQGIYGHFNPATTVPGFYPYFISRAKGCRFWDVDGNEYIDYACAYGPMILGYAHERVDEAFARQAGNGTATMPPSTLLIDLAEKMVEVNDCADWAVFAKNGADTISWAVALARGYRKRDKIVLAHGAYHGTQPWAGTNHIGVLPADRADILMVPWGDANAFRRVVEENKNRIAGALFTPYHHPVFEPQVLPEPGFWQDMRRICEENDIVLIIDDVRAGWRLDIKGSAHYFGFRPDLACYCKAIANGYPISALVGTDRMRMVAAKAFQTGSYWNNAPEMAAALACIDEMQKIDAAAICDARGALLRRGLEERAAAHGLSFRMSGPNAIPFLHFTNESNFKRAQLFCRECSVRGVYFFWHHNLFLSAAHTEADIRQTLDVADQAFRIVKEQFGE